MLSELCGEEGVSESMQNISTDDLPDSASQTAQQQDSKFSFRSVSRWGGNCFFFSSTFRPPVFMLVCFFCFFWCCFFFKWCEKEVAVGLVLSRLCGVANHDSRYHTKWTARSHGIWRWAWVSFNSIIIWCLAQFWLSLEHLVQKSIYHEIVSIGIFLDLKMDQSHLQCTVITPRCSVIAGNVVWHSNRKKKSKKPSLVLAIRHVVWMLIRLCCCVSSI